MVVSDWKRHVDKPVRQDSWCDTNSRLNISRKKSLSKKELLMYGKEKVIALVRLQMCGETRFSA